MGEQVDQLLDEISSLLELLKESPVSFVNTCKGLPELVNIVALEQDGLSTEGASYVRLSIVPSEQLLEYVSTLRAKYASPICDLLI